jgi:hypothetical protein
MTVLARPAATANDRPILSIASVQLENKITGRESQGACRQDELIGGKPLSFPNI